MKVNSLYPIIAVDNEEETIGFYETFGFKIKHKVIIKMNSHLYVLWNGEQEIELVETENAGSATILSGLYSLGMNVDDIEAADEG